MLTLTLPLLLFGLAPASVTPAQDAEAPVAVLFRDVRIFNGVDAQTTQGHVLVVGSEIARISSAPIAPPTGAEIIEGGGRLLSPGFIDLHAHLTLQAPKDRMLDHAVVAGALAGVAARGYLERGFTTVRDAGGTHPDLARLIDDGLLPGPRVFPSGAVVSQTAGHGDFRARHAGHPTLDPCVESAMGAGFAVLADGVPQTLAAVRENLRLGATQIKIMGGGGVASDYDPIHSLQPSPDEIRAAVQAASDFGTYVLAHAYTAEAIQRLVENGVKVIEHGLLIDEATARLCAERGIVISTQVSLFRKAGELPGMTDENRRKLAQVLTGQDDLMAYIKRFGIVTGFGTDFVFGSYTDVSTEFTARAEYFAPAQILRQATSESAEVVRLCGMLNRHGNFGELREGWLADLVLIEGDPLADISILEDYERSVLVVMKGGELVIDRR